MPYFKRICTSLLFFALISGLSAQHNWIRTNPGGGGAIAMVGATKSGLIVAAADLSGIYTSDDNGATWQAHGNLQGLTQPHISSLGFNPDDGNTFIMGTGIGAFKTTDAGQNIYPVNIELPPIMD